MRVFTAFQVTALACLLFFTGSAFAYDPPLGIPEPPFGIDEQTPAQPSSWPSTEAPGYYFVDNTHPNATDSNNPYGTPDRPRNSLPTSIGTWPAGTYVEVHGGPYTVSGNQWRIDTNGTESAPTWLVGDPVNKPTLRFELIPEDTSYFVIENLRFDTDRMWLRTSGTSDHLVIRFNEFTGDPNATGRTSVISVTGKSTGRSSDVVIYGNVIYGAGDRSGLTEVDYNGITNSAYIDRLWILENHIYNMGGDSVRIGQNQARMPAPDALPHFTYVGRNLFHDNGENAIDVKHSTDVIISENEMYGFAPVSSSAGEAVVIHENADYVWVLNNSVHDAAIGIINTGAENTWFISNLVYDISTSGSFDPLSHYGAGVAMHFRGNSSGGIVGNTLHNFDKGIQISSGPGYEVSNNIFSARNRPNSYDVMYSNSSLSHASVQNANMFVDFRARVSSLDYTSLSSFRSTYGHEQTGFVGNTSFINAAAANFALTVNSDAIDAGRESVAFEQFRQRYGLDIATDRDGVARPLGQAWDIGAHEFISGPRPMSPTNLSASP